MSDWSWAEFQKEKASMPPRPLLLQTLERYAGFRGHAIDLGCGSGVDIPLNRIKLPTHLSLKALSSAKASLWFVELYPVKQYTIHLLRSGWRVCAVDNTAVGFENIKGSVSQDELSKVEFKQAAFEGLILPEVDLLYSSYSIPFCKRKFFRAFWDTIVKAIKIGGRFSGHLFGEQDGWINLIPDMTLTAKREIDVLFESFDIEYFNELCEDRLSANGNGMKRWHVFEIVATKK